MFEASMDRDQIVQEFHTGLLLSSWKNKQWVAQCLNDDPSTPAAQCNIVRDLFTDVNESMEAFLRLPSLYKALIDRYSSGYSDWINVEKPDPFSSRLGFGRTDYEFIQVMNEIFDLLPPTRNSLTVWRGITMKDVSQLREHFGFISTTMDPEIASIFATKEQEETSDDESSFDSSEYEEEKETRPCCMFRIKVLPGNKILPLMAFETEYPEYEILLSRKGTLQVNGFLGETYGEDNVRIIEATYIPPPTSLGKRRRQVEWEEPEWQVFKRKQYPNVFSYLHDIVSGNKN